MDHSNQELAPVLARRTPMEEEQFLCNEALRTGAFDEISDNEWVSMCERAASRGKTAADEGDPGESVDIR